MAKPNRKKFVEQPEDIQDAFTPLSKDKKKRSLKEKLDSLIQRMKRDD